MDLITSLGFAGCCLEDVPGVFGVGVGVAAFSSSSMSSSVIFVSSPCVHNNNNNNDNNKSAFSERWRVSERWAMNARGWMNEWMNEWHRRGPVFVSLFFSLSMFRVTNFKFLKNVEERTLDSLSLASFNTEGEILSHFIARTHERARKQNGRNRKGRGYPSPVFLESREWRRCGRG